MSETRCTSRCRVVPEQWKRCIRNAGHDPKWERHLWVESLDRCDGAPSMMVWDDDEAERPAATYEIVTAKAQRVEGQAPVFRGVHILRGPLPPCDSDGGRGAGYGSACRPGCPAQPRYV